MNPTMITGRSRHSVFHHLEKACQKHGVASWSAASDPPTGDEAASSGVKFVAQVRTMSVWCRVVERLVVSNAREGSRGDAIVHAGFERLSRLTPVLARYRAIGKAARSVDVYGEPDAEVSGEGLRSIVFSGGPLANEWFLVVESARFKTVLAAEDLDGFGSGKPLAERRFRATASYHPAVVADVRAALELERDRLLRAASPAETGRPA